MITVTIYTKEDCCLCQEAKSILLALQKKRPFVLEEIDITSERGLYDKFKEEIPVIFINGRKAFKYRVDPGQLLSKLDHT